ALAAALLALRGPISCQLDPSPLPRPHAVRSREMLRLSREGNPVSTSRIRRRHQTRRLLRGRTPLCACGVTSLTPRISRPAACSERIAVSRPEPGPFTKTSTFCNPCSMPSRAHESAVTWAANGVDLREPLNPAEPADSPAITLPSLSVSATIVLLNDVLM